MKCEFILVQRKHFKINHFRTYSISIFWTTNGGSKLLRWSLNYSMIHLFITSFSSQFYYCLLFFRYKFFLTCNFQKQNFSLNPVPSGYRPIFCHWHFQHTYTRSSKEKINRKMKKSGYWRRCFLPIIHLTARHPITTRRLVLALWQNDATKNGLTEI